MDRLRLFQGEADLGGMLEVSDESMLMDGMGMINDPDSFRAVYSGYMDSLPSENAIVAEARGSIVGQGLVWWRDVAEGQRIYSYSTSVLPEFLDDRAGLMDWAEARLIRTASQHPPGIEKVLETQAVQGTRLESMVRARGYAPARRFVEMVRSLDDIPVVPAPGGISIMPAAEETICEAWAVAGGAFKDHWGYSAKNWSAERLQEIMQMETFDISLWLVAVAAGKVVGTARNVIKAGENAALGRKRGYISNVCVSRPWRRKGVAAALLSGSMARLRAAGMEEARLGADSESLTGAPGLYGKMGFAVSNSYVSYRKGMPPC